ncbi:hypothetical protein QVG61_10725 [Thiohalobacter sp. IOR34]|uniref:hypothetical protein n=1 Tax=Thiohalobacter sp. IOR34 TaxID=3057176 RepID=UPI0025B109C8|nr:hypothetical protein [Thiohalobacter sp. IOR34]WJW74967.1 hypothetical protein QVG61_10725 [Thiohalobacter sp. IOR34]
MKPSNEQMEAALAEAERLREADADPRGVAHMLLYLARRNAALERVCEVAERYVKFGLDENEHRQLLKALEAARETEDDIDLGLGSSS